MLFEWSSASFVQNFGGGGILSVAQFDVDPGYTGPKACSITCGQYDPSAPWEH